MWHSRNPSRLPLPFFPTLSVRLLSFYPISHLLPPTIWSGKVNERNLMRFFLRLVRFPIHPLLQLLGRSQSISHWVVLSLIQILNLYPFNVPVFRGNFFPLLVGSFKHLLAVLAVPPRPEALPFAVLVGSFQLLGNCFWRERDEVAFGTKG